MGKVKPPPSFPLLWASRSGRVGSAVVLLCCSTVKWTFVLQNKNEAVDPGSLRAMNAEQWWASYVRAMQFSKTMYTLRPTCWNTVYWLYFCVEVWWPAPVSVRHFHVLLTLRPALPADTSCPEQSSRFAGGQTGFVQMKQQNNPIPRINVCIFNKPQNAVVSRHKDQLIGTGDDHILDTLVLSPQSWLEIDTSSPWTCAGCFHIVHVFL